MDPKEKSMAENELYVPENRVPTIADYVIRHIMDLVTEGKLRPGDKIPCESELTKQLGISRTPLREAMKTLSALGIVDVRRGDGTYITAKINPNILDAAILNLMCDMSANEPLLETRRILDEAVLREAADKCGEDSLRRLDDINERLKAAFDCGNLREAARLDVQFHREMLACLNNPFLQKLVLGVYAVFERSIVSTVLQYPAESDAYKHHARMLDCIRRHDTASVHDTVEQSLSVWKNIFGRKFS